MSVSLVTVIARHRKVLAMLHLLKEITLEILRNH